MFLVLALLGAVLHGAEALPVVPLEWTPDQIAESLRTTKPLMPVGDCKALNISACNREFPQAVSDISIRWVQLDDDPELEAVIVAEAKAEWTYFALVFDWHGRWNLVGAIPCHRACESRAFVQIRKLTDDSPVFLILNQELGGSGALRAYTGYQLRAGKLWRVFEFDRFFASTVREGEVRIFVAGNRLILRTTLREPPNGPAKHSCAVQRWDAKEFRFVAAPAETKSLCASQAGRPFDRY
jgi:hypothetical protein